MFQEDLRKRESLFPCPNGNTCNRVIKALFVGVRENNGYFHVNSLLFLLAFIQLVVP
jgi:hypothetical protein